MPVGTFSVQTGSSDGKLLCPYHNLICWSRLIICRWALSPCRQVHLTANFFARIITSSVGHVIICAGGHFLRVDRLLVISCAFGAVVSGKLICRGAPCGLPACVGGLYTKVGMRGKVVEQSRFGYGFAQTPSVPLLRGRNKTEPYTTRYKTRADVMSALECLFLCVDLFFLAAQQALDVVLVLDGDECADDQRRHR